VPYIVDTVHRSPELGPLEKIELPSLVQHNQSIYPLASTLKFGCPARSEDPAMTLSWYDGHGKTPPIPVAFAGRDTN